MPSWPLPPGRRTVTVHLPTEQVQHLDQQAAYEGCSRSAYFRQLIRRDIERQGITTLQPTTRTPAADRRFITIDVRDEHVTHLDQRAQALSCSRNAYIRFLIIADMRRQGPTPALAHQA
jgi:hypothetical protein